MKDEQTNMDLLVCTILIHMPLLVHFVSVIGST